jgi:hypothetical protein
VPKLTDFGLAKKLEGEVGHTRTGEILGTPAYMAPEQAEGRPQDVGPATDVYALGVILYELLTGHPPFRAATVLETLLQVRNDEPVSLRRLQPNTPRDLETVCLKCLAKEPGRRYGSARDLAEDLRSFAAGEPIRARRAGLAERGVKWCRRRPAAAALIAVLALTLAGAVAAVPWHIHRLGAERDEARAEANESRTSEQRLAARAACAQALLAGQEALALKDLGEARAQFTSARDRARDAGAREDPGLAELEETAVRRLEELSRQDKAREEYQAVSRLRDEALFLLHRDAFTGTDTASPTLSQEAARRALAPYGLPDRSPGPGMFGGLEGDEPERLRTGLYEVCLILAEALACPLPGQGADEKRRNAAAALSVLDRVALLAPGGRDSPLQRSRYLAQQGDVAAAARERARDEERNRTALEWFFDGCDKAFGENQPAQALKSFDEALGMQADLFRVHFFRAVVCQKLRQPEEARASLTVCAGKRKDFVWTYLLRGSLCGQVGAFRAAGEDFSGAEGLVGDDPSARYVLLVNRGFVACAGTTWPGPSRTSRRPPA